MTKRTAYFALQLLSASLLSASPPIVTLTASDTDILSGGETTLLWTSSGASSLSIDQGIGDVTAQTDPSGNGSLLESNIVGTTTYTITATNAEGSAQDSVTITTGPAPVINSFALVEPNPVPGEAVQLTWDVSNADTLVLSPSIGSVNPLSGTACDFPVVDTTYTLTATNEFSQSTAQVGMTLPQALELDANLWTVTQLISAPFIENLTQADAVLAGSGVLASQTVNNVAAINYGSGSDGEFPGDVPPPLGDVGPSFVVRATATLIVNFPGEYTFGINNDDGGRLRIDGVDVIVDDATHLPLTTNGTRKLEVGVYPIEYVYFEEDDGSAGEVFFVNNAGANQQFPGPGPAITISTTGVIINEVMADNRTTLDDFEGQSSDWIELYNGSGSAINLAGYYLTDDLTIPNKWALPSYSLPHGGYLVIFASGKNTTFGTAEFHTNFKLNDNGEYLALSRDIGGGGFAVVTEFSPNYPPQREDVSYGTWGHRQTLGFMPSPTPGRLNFGGVDGFVGDTHFDHDRGIFFAPFDLTITTDHPAATIRYTTDGSEPTLNHGTIYASPIPISQTTVIRAAGFFKGYQPTNIDTHTYLFPDDVPLQDQAHAVARGFPGGPVNGQIYEYGMAGGFVSDAEIAQALQDLPTISLVMEQEDFSSSATGIFSNAQKTGRGWERPSSIELLNENGNGLGQFQKNCGVRIRGGFSRIPANPKHAFRLFFRNEYEGDLQYPLFQDEGASRFENLDLRTAQNYSWSLERDGHNTFLREIHGRDAQREMGQPYTRSRYYHLYLNGVYWGLFMSQERSENYYGQTYLGGDEDFYDVIKSSGDAGNYKIEASDGNLDAWQDLFSKVRNVRANPSDNAAYFAMQGLAPDGMSPHPDPVNNPDLLEVDNMIDYLLVMFYTGNYDSPISVFLEGGTSNWFCMRDRNGTDGFRFFVHDGEHSLGTDDYSDDRVGPWTTAGQYALEISQFERSNPQYFHEDLAFNAEYRLAFADRVHKHFFNGGTLTDAVALARLDARSTEIQNAVRAELARWGRDFSYTHWLNARQDIINFINLGVDGAVSEGGRTAHVLGFLQNYTHNGSKPLYPPIDAPVYSVNGGTVPTGFQLGITNPNGSGTVYYTTDGSDPRLVGGAVSSSAIVAGPTVTLTASGLVRARVLSGGTWSALNDFEFIVGVAGSAADLVVSELHYNPTGTASDTFLDKDDYEFIELLNLSTTDTIELTGVRFANGITFEFTGSNVTQLLPGERVVVVKNLAAFTERYPSVVPAVIAGVYTGSLENAGERITLLDSTGASIKDFIYNDRFPWPISPDGDGYSVVLNCDTANPDHNLAANWRSHAMLHGNPGGPDGETWADFVALHGITGDQLADVDLDGTSDYLEYIFGTDPLDKQSDKPADISFQQVFVDGIFQEFLTITVQRNLKAGEIRIFPEVSTDLFTWNDVDIIMYDALNQGNGTESISWRAILPLFDPAKPRCYMRLRIEKK